MRKVSDNGGYEVKQSINHDIIE